jgi:heme oxygenase (biliverdin-IX-beta and delta-forming)
MNSTATVTAHAATPMGLVRPPSILHQLKQQTAAHHLQLETEADIWPSLSCLDEYRKLIITMFGIYKPLESRLQAVEELSIFLPDVGSRWKSQTLTRDLAALGVFPGSTLMCPDIVAILNVAQAFGCLYVLEGSTLGGQIISRQLQAKLALTPENGCAFFSSYGPRVGQMWKVFGERLEMFCSDHPESREQIVQAALATFEYFTRQLVRNKIVVPADCV